MVSLSPWTKKSGRCREVAVIAEVRLYIKTGYNGNPQQAIVLVFLVTVSMQRAVYIFSPVSEKVPRALKFD